MLELRLIQQVSTKPIEDAENIVRWQIFNVLAGNSDGHAKNLSLLYNNNQLPQLAPIYDLVCTRAIERIDAKLALSVGGEFDPDKVALRHWEMLADECGIRKQYLKKLIQQLSLALLDAVSDEQFQLCLEKFPSIQRIKKIVLKQCQRILKQI